MTSASFLVQAVDPWKKAMRHPVHVHTQTFLSFFVSVTLLRLGASFSDTEPCGPCEKTFTFSASFLPGEWRNFCVVECATLHSCSQQFSWKRVKRQVLREFVVIICKENPDWRQGALFWLHADPLYPEWQSCGGVEKYRNEGQKENWKSAKSLENNRDSFMLFLVVDARQCSERLTTIVTGSKCMCSRAINSMLLITANDRFRDLYCS